MNSRQWEQKSGSPEFQKGFEHLYGDLAEAAIARCIRTLHGYQETFGDTQELSIFSAPGRTELSGNHTDHQHGRVLAAAVNLDMLVAASPNGSDSIRLQSEGYAPCEIGLGDLSVHADEARTTAAILRGVAAGFLNLGYPIRGFNAYVTSSVLCGSGLSSSAAFEVLLGTALNGLFCGDRVSPLEVAKIGQRAENKYYGKPCGLMDQTASSIGNIISIDFKDTENPVVDKLDFDFSRCGYSLCIIDSGADHADLTEEYASIPRELKEVCGVFGRDYLRQVPEELFYGRIAEVRKATGDRAVLRAIHVFEENRRVNKQISALNGGDFETFLDGVAASGQSSWRYLQNVIPTGNTRRQELAFTLAMCERLLAGRGACRVHGGGFAGTIQAFVPNEALHAFRANAERALGEGRCHILSIRPAGGIRL